MVAELNRTDYRQIVEHAVAGIFQTTVEGQFIIANSALARMLGFESPDELIRERTDLSRQHYVKPALREEFKRLLEAQGLVRGFEYEAYRKDGSRMWISENARALKDDNGILLYYEGSAEDISNRRGAEDEAGCGREGKRSTGSLSGEQARRRETEILRDANIALTENLTLEIVLETFLDYLNKLVPPAGNEVIRIPAVGDKDRAGGAPIRCNIPGVRGNFECGPPFKITNDGAKLLVAA